MRDIPTNILIGRRTRQYVGSKGCRASFAVSSVESLSSALDATEVPLLAINVKEDHQ